MVKKISESEIMSLLAEVTDPEIPVLNIIELGIVRNVIYDNDLLIVNITPTYSACPAIETIKQDIFTALLKSGIKKFEVNVTYSPAWTTDWITDDALKKLRRYGISPPAKINDSIISEIEYEKINCPFCDSESTELKSYFGSTACKSLYYCNNCMQPFEHFKKF